MQADNYPNACATTESRKSEILLDGACQTRFLHAILGITTESGELTDLFKKWLFYGRRFTAEQVIEELGDLLWYTGILMHEMQVSPEEVMTANIAKLRSRYPEAFDHVQSGDRDLEAESKALMDVMGRTLADLNFFGQDQPLTRREPFQP